MSDELREAVATALEPYDIPTGAWTAAEKAEPIDAILAAIEPLVVEREALVLYGTFTTPASKPITVYTLRSGA